MCQNGKNWRAEVRALEYAKDTKEGHESSWQTQLIRCELRVYSEDNVIWHNVADAKS